VAASSGRTAGRFPAADEVDQVAGPKHRVGRPDFAQNGSGNALLIAAIVDGEIGGVAEQADVAFEDTDAERVERRNFRVPVELLAQHGG